MKIIFIFNLKLLYAIYEHGFFGATNEGTYEMVRRNFQILIVLLIITTHLRLELETFSWVSSYNIFKFLLHPPFTYEHIVLLFYHNFCPGNRTYYYWKYCCPLLWVDCSHLFRCCWLMSMILSEQWNVNGSAAWDSQTIKSSTWSYHLFFSYRHGRIKW